MSSNEASFFLDGLRRRLIRARLAVVWAERTWLMSNSPEDFDTMVEAMQEKRNAIRAIREVSELVAA
jgi:hypothetical protein